VLAVVMDFFDSCKEYFSGLVFTNTGYKTILFFKKKKEYGTTNS
jgi:hypothetical protein